MGAAITTGVYIGASAFGVASHWSKKAAIVAGILTALITFGVYYWRMQVDRKNRDKEDEEDTNLYITCAKLQDGEGLTLSEECIEEISRCNLMASENRTFCKLWAAKMIKDSLSFK